MSVAPGRGPAAPVSKGDVVVHPVDDRLHALPSGRRVAEQPPGGVAELVGLAVPAREGEVQGRVGQVGDSGLGCGVRRPRRRRRPPRPRPRSGCARCPGRGRTAGTCFRTCRCTREGWPAATVSTPAVLSASTASRRGLHLEHEGDRPVEVMEEFTAHAKPTTARGGVDHEPDCTAELPRVNRSRCTIAGSGPCAPRPMTTCRTPGVLSIDDNRGRRRAGGSPTDCPAPPTSASTSTAWSGRRMRSCSETLERAAGTLPQMRRDAQQWFADRGVTFGVPTEGVAPIFPFDPIPRVLSSAEWRSLSRALVAARRWRSTSSCPTATAPSGRSATAWYPDGWSTAAPGTSATSSASVLPEPRGATCRGSTWCGWSGTFHVLEDNVRIPSGIAYALESRRAMESLAPDWFELAPVRPIHGYTGRLRRILQRIAPTAVGRGHRGAHSRLVQRRVLRAPAARRRDERHARRGT